MLENRAPYRKRPTAGPWYRKRPVVLTAASLVLAAVVMAAGYGGWRVLCHSSFFMATSIRIQGLHRLDRRTVEDLAGIDARTNLLAFSDAGMEAAIMEHPWVRMAVVDKQWPNGLLITVMERVPVALVNLDQELYYLDEDGTPYTAVRPGDDLDFPVISGLHSGDDIRSHPGVRNALEFLRLAGRGRASLPRQNISEMVVGEDGSLVLFLVDRPFPIHLGRDRMGTTYYRLAKVLSWLYKKKDFKITEYIRMDYLPDRVLVGRAG